MKVVTPQRLEEEEEGGSGSLAKVNVLEYVKKKIKELRNYYRFYQFFISRLMTFTIINSLHILAIYKHEMIRSPYLLLTAFFARIHSKNVSLFVFC